MVNQNNFYVADQVRREELEKKLTSLEKTNSDMRATNIALIKSSESEKHLIPVYKEELLK